MDREKKHFGEGGKENNNFMEGKRKERLLSSPPPFSFVISFRHQAQSGVALPSTPFQSCNAMYSFVGEQRLFGKKGWW